MGANIRIRTLHDAARRGFHIKVTCGNAKCGRSEIYLAQSVANVFGTSAKARNAAMEVAGSYFRCEQCRWRGARLELVAPPSPREPPKLVPTARELRQRANRERG